MVRDSIVFYRSFYEAIRNLPRDVQGEIYTAIMEYGLYGNETEDLKPIAHSIFSLMKPLIDANIRRYENGRKGGRPKAEENRKNPEPKPNNNQTITKGKPNDNDNVNDNDNDNKLSTDVDSNIVPNEISKFIEQGHSIITDESSTCECISKSTGEQCRRKSFYVIDGKYYCNQHSKDFFRDYYQKGKNKAHPPVAPPPLPDQEQEFVKFQKWIMEKAPRVAKMEEPFTQEEYLRIKEEFPPGMTAEVLLAMHNSKDLLKKNLSANLTFRNWIQRRLKDSTNNGRSSGRVGQSLPAADENEKNRLLAKIGG